MSKPRPIINGTFGPIRKSLDISYDPSRGRVVTEEYESAGDNLGGMAALCEKRRIAYQLRASPIHSKLTLTATGEYAGTPIFTADTWQLVANEMQNDIKQHPDYIALSPSQRQAVVAALANIESGDPDLAVNLTTFKDVYGPEAFDFLSLQIRGTTHYPVSQYVLRHTANVWNGFVGLTDDDGAGEIYSTAQLVAEVSTGWTFNCPPRLIAKIQSVGKSGTPHDGYVFGWLKKASTENTSANNRIDISSEYWFFEWSKRLYPLRA